MLYIQFKEKNRIKKQDQDIQEENQEEKKNDKKNDNNVNFKIVYLFESIIYTKSYLRSVVNEKIIILLSKLVYSFIISIYEFSLSTYIRNTITKLVTKFILINTNTLKRKK